jgi:hypothetical protein
MTAIWVRNPHAGGVKIPDALQRETERRLLTHAANTYAGRYARLGIWFRGPFCYVDAYQEPPAKLRAPPGESVEQFRERLRETPTHLCRLRHCGQNQWSVAFFTYSHEKYEPTMFHSGGFHGTPEEGLDIGAIYLDS